MEKSNNVDIETVANYCYLGMVLKFDGNFNLAINGTRGSQEAVIAHLDQSCFQ
jgi:hypothetical protein